MASLRAAQHAVRIAEKVARRRGGGYITTTRQGRGFGLAVHEPEMVERLPKVVAGVSVELHERKQRRWRRGVPLLDVLRRRPRRRRRPTPEMVAGRLRYEYNGRTGQGRYIGINKRRRERARLKRRQNMNDETLR